MAKKAPVIEKPYEHEDYPLWMYHPEYEAVLCDTPEDVADLGPGWADSPTAFAEPEKPGVRGKRKKVAPDDRAGTHP